MTIYINLYTIHMYINLYTIHMYQNSATKQTQQQTKNKKEEEWCKLPYSSTYGKTLYKLFCITNTGQFPPHLNMCVIKFLSAYF